MNAKTAVSRKTYAVIPKHDPQVTMSNALVRAGHGLTLAEKRVVMLAVSKLDSRAPTPAPHHLCHEPRSRQPNTRKHSPLMPGQPTKPYRMQQNTCSTVKSPFSSPPTHGPENLSNPYAMTCDGWGGASIMRMKVGSNCHGGLIFSRPLWG